MSTKCYYHPQNSLHNFCLNTQCALPLCPKCINIHLNQTNNQKHHIQSLGQTKQMIKQQLQTSLQAIQHNLNAIQKGEYTPQFCMKEYEGIVEKYREEAIKAINDNYDYIKRELFEQLKSKYNSHLSNIVRPLQQNMMQLKKYTRNLQERPIQCMIKMVSQQIIMHIQKFLQHIQQKKQDFKSQLPRLEGMDGNLLKLIPGGIDMMPNKTYRQPQESLNRSRNLRQTSRFYQLDEYDKINKLQAQLYSLRNQYY